MGIRFLDGNNIVLNGFQVIAKVNGKIDTLNASVRIKLGGIVEFSPTGKDPWYQVYPKKK